MRSNVKGTWHALTFTMIGMHAITRIYCDLIGPYQSLGIVTNAGISGCHQTFPRACEGLACETNQEFLDERTNSKSSRVDILN